MKSVHRFVLAIATAFLATLCGISPPASAMGQPWLGFGRPLYNVASAYSAWPQRPSLDEAWMVAPAHWPSVVAVNEADAVTEGCTGCEAAAVAFQVVIASNFNSLTLTNNASSIQTDCVSCNSAAIAEQWVVGSSSQRLLLTSAGRVALSSVHSQLSDLLHSGAAPSQIADDMPVFEAEIDNVLSQDVVVVQEQPRPPPPPFAGNRPPPAGQGHFVHLVLARNGPMVLDSTPAESVTVTPENGFTIYHYSQVCPDPSSCAPPSS
jgi:hypothetical protein